MAKTKYILNSYFRVICDCELFAVKLKKNDVLCFNAMGWNIIGARNNWYYSGELKQVSIDVLVPLKKNELGHLLMREVDTR